MPKKENYDKNHQASEAARKRRQALTQTPERKAAQLLYRIDSINQRLKRGDQTPGLEEDMDRLCRQLEALSQQHPTAIKGVAI
jgi:hypothetical protein